MMITRFNAECKKRLEGKGKFTAKEGLGIGAASAIGIPYGIAEKEARGLKPKWNVSDGGSGLVKGFRQAFPEAETQQDIKPERSRGPERIGTSALERLTERKQPEFLDALLSPPRYFLSGG